MAYASAADLILRKDVRVLGDLVADDGTRVAAGSLAANAVLAAMLDDASGEIDASLRQGDKYTVANLAALTGNSLAHLKRITCDIAFWLLWERRPTYGDEEMRDDVWQRAKRALDALKAGREVFDVAENVDAGNADLETPSFAQIQQQNLIVDQARGPYYPQRLGPIN